MEVSKVSNIPLLFPLVFHLSLFLVSISRYCLFPQELVVKIDPPGRIRKLQLLSHQHLIASTVEIYVGHFTSDGHTSLDHAKFSRLGYISLSSNESNRYKVARDTR